MDSNPFAILTFIAAPAVLTNASSVLALGTSNRFGRNVDRARQLIKLLEASRAAISATEETRAEEALNRKLLGWMESRMALLMRGALIALLRDRRVRRRQPYFVGGRDLCIE